MLQQKLELTSAAIKEGLGNPEPWPTADSCYVDTLTPCLTPVNQKNNLTKYRVVLAWRERMLSESGRAGRDAGCVI